MARVSGQDSVVKINHRQQRSSAGYKLRNGMAIGDSEEDINLGTEKTPGETDVLRGLRVTAILLGEARILSTKQKTPESPKFINENKEMQHIPRP